MQLLTKHGSKCLFWGFWHFWRPSAILFGILLIIQCSWPFFHHFTLWIQEFWHFSAAVGRGLAENSQNSIIEKTWKPRWLLPGSGKISLFSCFPPFYSREGRQNPHCFHILNWRNGQKTVKKRQKRSKKCQNGQKAWKAVKTLREYTRIYTTARGCYFWGNGEVSRSLLPDSGNFLKNTENTKNDTFRAEKRSKTEQL